MRKIVYLFGLLAIIAFGCSENGNKSNAEMTFESETEYNYGKIVHQGNGIHEFNFKNTGNVPLVVTNVKSTCGCTVPTYPTEPVKEGKTGIIKVKYDTNRIGIFTKSITVYSNAANSPIKLVIKGEVDRPTEEIIKKEQNS